MCVQHLSGQQVSTAQEELFKPGSIGGLELRNRLIRAGTSESMAGDAGEITDELMRRIQALTNQEYVHDTYGAEMKKRYEAVLKAGRNLLDHPVEGQR